MNLLFNIQKKYLLFFLILIIHNSFVYAQEGSPFITNYEIKNQYKFQNWSIIQDDDNIMFFANQKGILSFDGFAWEMITTPTMPLTMYADTTYKKVYVGCVDDAGYIEKIRQVLSLLYQSIKIMIKLVKQLEFLQLRIG